MRIVFFNHYHNGDVFASKEYVREIATYLPEAQYFHSNSSKLLLDLPVDKIDSLPGGIGDRTLHEIFDDTLYLNTWIGPYFSLLDIDGCNWLSYNKMFARIYAFLHGSGIANIELKSPNDYVPTIDYSIFDVQENLDMRNTIMMSNGPSLSGQSNTVSGFDELIIRLLNATDYGIVLTHPSAVASDRIYYTSNIIDTLNGDLNEISHLSTKSGILVGRNSGPFCFMHTKEILGDKDKKIISIGNKEQDSFVFNMNVDSQYHFVNDNCDDWVDQVLERI